MSWFKSFQRAVSAASLEGHYSSESLNNFTPRAAQVLALARKEANRFNHNFVGTEHLLLGLIRLGQGTAVNVLRRMSLDLETIRDEVEKQVGTGPDQKMIGLIPYTPRTKRVLALAAKEARALNHSYIGTEHILLGILREGDGVAARILKNLEVDLEYTRQQILTELDPNFVEADLEKQPRSVSSEHNPLDTTKRYDVYCAERTEQLVVYSNALFKSRKRLPMSKQHELFPEFIELEQSDGKVIFVVRTSIVKFCEHGVNPVFETVPKQ